MNEMGLLLVAFLFPLKPTVCKADCPAILPQRFKHSAGGDRFDARVYQWCFVPPAWRVGSEDRVKMQLLVAFAQQQNFSTGRDVVPANRLRVVCDVMVVFVGKI